MIYDIDRWKIKIAGDRNLISLLDRAVYKQIVK